MKTRVLIFGMGSSVPEDVEKGKCGQNKSFLVLSIFNRKNPQRYTSDR